MLLLLLHSYNISHLSHQQAKKKILMCWGCACIYIFAGCGAPVTMPRPSGQAIVQLSIFPLLSLLIVLHHINPYNWLCGKKGRWSGRHSSSASREQQLTRHWTAFPTQLLMAPVRWGAAHVHNSSLMGACVFLFVYIPGIYISMWGHYGWCVLTKQLLTFDRQKRIIRYDFIHLNFPMLEDNKRPIM